MDMLHFAIEGVKGYYNFNYFTIALLILQQCI